MHVAFQAFLLGLFLMLFVGPSFFYLIKVGIQKGFVPAAFFALGIIFSDLTMILLILFGLSNVFESLLFKESFSLIAGFIIVGLGIYSILKPKGRSSTGKVKDLLPYQYTLRGFGINIVNPFSFMVWIAVLGGISLKRDFTNGEYITFISVLLGTVLMADVAKAYGANALGKIMNDKVVHLVNRVLGFIFIVLGVRMLYFFYELYTYGNQSLQIDAF